MRHVPRTNFYILLPLLRLTGLLKTRCSCLVWSLLVNLLITESNSFHFVSTPSRIFQKGGFHINWYLLLFI